MQVPIRKPGQYTHAKPDPNMTEAKLKEYKKELDKLVKFSRPRAAEELKRTIQMGDLSENAAYSVAKGRLRGINERIIELENIIKNVVLIQPHANNYTVQLGCHVTVKINSQTKTYLILGSTETNPSQGIISHLSPIGAALMNHKVGDKVKITLTDKVTEYEIIKIT